MTASSAPFFAEQVVAINGAVYEEDSAVREYTTPALLPSEAAIFAKYASDIVGKRVLDIACGAGRTTYYLRHLTRHYTGTDVSARMLEYCRRQPGCAQLRLVQDDMRNVDAFGPGVFDFVLISANGIDHLDDADRLDVLKKLRRVLVPGGLLVFSAHNKVFLDSNWGGEVPLQPIGRLLDPRRMLRDPARHLRALRRALRTRRNHQRLRPMQRFERDYSIVVGQAHEHSILSYWINPTVQARRIGEIGFELLETYDTYRGTGEPLDLSGDTRQHSAVYFVARNP